MGTFHQNRGPLHGITVVIETTDDALLIGRYDREEPRGIVLLDVARCPEGADGAADAASRAARRADFLARASRFGVWKEHDAVLVPAAAVRSIRRLGDVEAAAS